jgi:staphyloferrin B biosynthesis citrate synthase
MTDNRPHPRAFRHRLRAGEPLLGTFMKVPAPQNTEIIGLLGFDFVVLDEEHAPWTRATIDQSLLAARAAGIAGLVRIARHDASSVLSALDDGAIGVMCPHVDSGQKARELVSWAKYHGGVRGAGVSRGCDYGTLPDMTRAADAFTTVICMIEDRQALDAVHEISSIDDVDAIFLGRGDLGLSLSNATDPVPALADAVEDIVRVARDNGKPVSAVVQTMQSDEAKWLIDLGVTAMMVAQDMTFLRQAASGALRDFNALMKNQIG